MTCVRWKFLLDTVDGGHVSISLIFLDERGKSHPFVFLKRAEAGGRSQSNFSIHPRKKKVAVKMGSAEI